ncbi:Arginine--tRNA ligase [compost metagenome]
MPPAIMLKKDGSSLYHTRDVTAAIYRYDTYQFHQAIYVTDYSQNLHFKQWFKIIEMMDYPWAKGLTHVPFGRISLAGSGFSTRKGNIVKLEDVLNQAIDKTKAIIQEKNPHLPHADEVAKQVGVGAVIFNDLSNNRIKDIVFSWDHILNFKGETGPYVQYVHARCCRLLAESKLDDTTLVASLSTLYEELPSHYLTPESTQLLKQLSLFSEKIIAAMQKLEPSLISRYLIDLAQVFNRFYHENKILVEDTSLRTFRLGLVLCTQTTLRNGLALIGVQAPKQI